MCISSEQFVRYRITWPCLYYLWLSCFCMKIHVTDFIYALRFVCTKNRENKAQTKLRLTLTTKDNCVSYSQRRIEQLFTRYDKYLGCGKNYVKNERNISAKNVNSSIFISLCLSNLNQLQVPRNTTLWISCVYCIYEERSLNYRNFILRCMEK